MLPWHLGKEWKMGNILYQPFFHTPEGQRDFRWSQKRRGVVRNFSALNKAELRVRGKPEAYLEQGKLSGPGSYRGRYPSAKELSLSPPPPVGPLWMPCGAKMVATGGGVPLIFIMSPHPQSHSWQHPRPCHCHWLSLSTTLCSQVVAARKAVSILGPPCLHFGAPPSPSQCPPTCSPLTQSWL